ncbi:hypothetical protein FACS1894198_0100 [Clostridia bacterium]|nr:hypothetical protein FACS1894198_0100 [Clostridia bacterium]
MNKKQRFPKILCMILAVTNVSLMLAPASSALPPLTPGRATVKNFLIAAMQPLGSTLYVWSGGWDETDKLAGPGAKCIEPLPQWRVFFESQGPDYKHYKNYYGPDPGADGNPNPDYDLEKFNEEIRAGLDCGGHVGRSIIMCRGEEERKADFRVGACAKECVERGWGQLKEQGDVTDYKPGDIMSIPKKHVWICLGRCKDGSIVLVHASPPGVHLCGTTLPGKEDSEAVKLASRYMTKYFPEWNKKYPRYSRDGVEYLKGSNQMRWDVSGTKFMSDPEGYTQRAPEEILRELFGD